MTFALPTPAAAGAFLLRNWLPVALGFALAVQTVRIEGFGVWPLKIVGLQQKYETTAAKLAAEHAGRLADRAGYTNSQAAAAALNKAQVAQKETTYRENANETLHDYAADHARLRSELERVRQQKLAAASSAPHRTGSSQVAAAPARIDGDGMPLSPDEHLQAAEIELRLMHLQNLYEKQVATDHPSSP